ncbi:hypothetical protein ACFVT5_41485 [Streptomyces sp. NPDC058001]|uniref:hypothetical protein n=1 Tax=Streptomyces sp. NPDC058001 TaxID=3346300 RepID=UPI0036E23D47
MFETSRQFLMTGCFLAGGMEPGWERVGEEAERRIWASGRGTGHTRLVTGTIAFAGLVAMRAVEFHVGAVQPHGSLRQFTFHAINGVYPHDFHSFSGIDPASNALPDGTSPGAAGAALVHYVRTRRTEIDRRTRTMSDLVGRAAMARGFAKAVGPLLVEVSDGMMARRKPDPTAPPARALRAEYVPRLRYVRSM